MIDTGFEPHQCLFACTWKRTDRPPCWPPEVNLRECVTHMPSPRANKAGHLEETSHCTHTCQWEWPHVLNSAIVFQFLKKQRHYQQDSRQRIVKSRER